MRIFRAEWHCKRCDKQHELVFPAKSHEDMLVGVCSFLEGLGILDDKFDVVNVEGDKWQARLVTPVLVIKEITDQLIDPSPKAVARMVQQSLLRFGVRARVDSVPRPWAGFDIGKASSRTVATTYEGGHKTHQHDGAWWFWDEDVDHRIGPFETAADAELCAMQYFARMATVTQ